MKSILGVGSPPKKTQVPVDWVHRLIQTGNDEWLVQYRRRLPSAIASTAIQFVDARNHLINLDATPPTSQVHTVLLREASGRK